METLKELVVIVCIGWGVIVLGALIVAPFAWIVWVMS